MSPYGFGIISYQDRLKAPSQWTKFASCWLLFYSGGKVPACHEDLEEVHVLLC